MPKKKKTRKQKGLADTRHREYFVKPLEEVKLEPIQIESKVQVGNKEPQLENKQPQQAIVIANYSYVYSDLLKALLLTISIIVAELVFRHFVFGA